MLALYEKEHLKGGKATSNGNCKFISSVGKASEFKNDDSRDNLQPKVWIKTGYFQKVNKSSAGHLYPSALASANKSGQTFTPHAF